MNSKWHFWMSIVKSILRLGGCSLTLYFKEIVFLAVLFMFAEFLGILEEIGDNR